MGLEIAQFNQDGVNITYSDPIWTPVGSIEILALHLNYHEVS